jgi:hypothetical protein
MPLLPVDVQLYDFQYYMIVNWGELSLRPGSAPLLSLMEELEGSGTNNRNCVYASPGGVNGETAGEVQNQLALFPCSSILTA